MDEKADHRCEAFACGTEVAYSFRADQTGYVRWVICGLLFFATPGSSSPFQLAYALMMPFAGRLIDRLGTRFGYAIAVVVWSAASAGDGLVMAPSVGY